MMKNEPVVKRTFVSPKYKDIQEAIANFFRTNPTASSKEYVGWNKPLPARFASLLAVCTIPENWVHTFQGEVPVFMEPVRNTVKNTVGHGTVEQCWFLRPACFPEIMTATDLTDCDRFKVVVTWDADTGEIQRVVHEIRI